ncbi:MAG: HAMP domain-containing protein [Melioribacteraceae bacterium]|nr:HAMP domain-containing protein [Melioribacteraceae bacterium]
MFRKIGLKLILVVSLTAIVIIGVYSYINVKAQSDVLQAEIERHGNELSEILKSSIHQQMMYNQREHLRETIKSVGTNYAIKDIRILNKVGEIIHSPHAEDIGKMVDKDAESCYACHAANEPLERLTIKERTRIFKMHTDSSRILGIINPIYNEKSCYEAECHAHPESATVLGVLDLTIPLDEVDKQIRENEKREVIFALIAITGIGFIIGFFVKRWVDYPVKELVKATDQVSAGNLNYRIKNLGSDELGRLSTSFNNMTKNLSEMREQLFQSDKLASLGQLAAGVAHEINNPLTGVLTYSSFLLKRTKDNPEMQEDLKVIVRETMRSREIVKGLLDFARQSTPKKMPIDLNEVIERSILVANNQLKINHIQLAKELDSELPKLTADANQLEQVFINLLVNAIDAIKSNGKITIKTSLLSLSPKGITHIKKAVCGKTHSLMDSNYKIGGMSSIKLKIRSNGNEGFAHLDPLYGSGRHYFGITKDKNNIQLSCPTCDTSLIDKSKNCPECGGPIYKIHVPEKGFIEGCASFKDNWQVWEHVEFGGQKKFIEIKVSDNGSGIPAENLSKIFDPFFSTKGQKGTGLGLSVIWGIIDNHNGTINVESEIDKGTTFSIRLPQA